jgi:hypothetical protein
VDDTYSIDRCMIAVRLVKEGVAGTSALGKRGFVSYS